MPYRRYTKRYTRRARGSARRSRKKTRVRTRKAYSRNVTYKRARRSRFAPSDVRKTEICGTEFTTSTPDQQTLVIHETPFPTSIYSLSGGEVFNKPGQRSSSSIYAKGVHIWYEFNNLGCLPVLVQCALLQLKQPYAVSADLAVDFFREYEKEATRTKTFKNYATDTFYKPEYKHFGLNQDKFYVINRSKFIVDQRCGATKDVTLPPPPPTVEQTTLGLNQARHCHIINKYYPINRVMNFETTDDKPNHPIFFVYWVQALTNVDSNELAGNPSISCRGYHKLWYKQM